MLNYYRRGKEALTIVIGTIEGLLCTYNSVAFRSYLREATRLSSGANEGIFGSPRSYLRLTIQETNHDTMTAIYIKEFWSENYLPLKENSFTYIESYI